MTTKTSTKSMFLTFDLKINLLNGPIKIQKSVNCPPFLDNGELASHYYFHRFVLVNEGCLSNMAPVSWTYTKGHFPFNGNIGKVRSHIFQI